MSRWHECERECELVLTDSRDPMTRKHYETDTLQSASQVQAEVRGTMAVTWGQPNPEISTTNVIVILESQLLPILGSRQR